ncbi:MAG: hypothetical protein ACR2K6_01575 [Solirubrobacterales bacterium]
MVPPQMREGVQLATEQAFTSSLNDILLIAVVVAAVGSALAFALFRSEDFVAPVDELPPRDSGGDRRAGSRATMSV